MKLWAVDDLWKWRDRTSSARRAKVASERSSHRRKLPDGFPLQNLRNFSGQGIARAGFRKKLHAGVQAAAIDDRILGIPGCQKHGNFG
jgi:hypothetical protein